MYRRFIIMLGALAHTFTSLSTGVWTLLAIPFLRFAHTQLHSARARENNGPHKRGKPGFRGYPPPPQFLLFARKRRTAPIMHAKCAR